MTVPDAQAIAFVGQPIISAVAVKGTPRAVPPGTRFMSNDVARRDLLRAVKNARAGINLVGLLLWFVAATIIGSVIYLSALERVHDFAVFKATGTSSATVLADLVVQAVLLSLVSAGIGVLVAKVLGPRFPVPVVIPASSLLLLPLLAVAWAFSRVSRACVGRSRWIPRSRSPRRDGRRQENSWTWRSAS